MSRAATPVRTLNRMWAARPDGAVGAQIRYRLTPSNRNVEFSFLSVTRNAKDLTIHAYATDGRFLGQFNMDRTDFRQVFEVR